MGLFSKETCAFCGKEAGVMHRSKLQEGIQTSQEIEAGKVKKGLFGRLKK